MDFDMSLTLDKLLKQIEKEPKKEYKYEPQRKAIAARPCRKILEEKKNPLRGHKNKLVDPSRIRLITPEGTLSVPFFSKFYFFISLLILILAT